MLRESIIARDVPKFLVRDNIEDNHIIFLTGV